MFDKFIDELSEERDKIILKINSGNLQYKNWDHGSNETINVE